MNKVLVIQSSPLGEYSMTRKVIDKLQKKIIEQYPSVEILERDLTIDPPPHLTTATLMDFREIDPARANDSSIKLSDKLIQELEAADTVIIAAPMWNFGVPSSLKAWIDHIARAGKTFKYTESGSVGLLENKKAIAILSNGGVYSEGPMSELDFVKPYLKTAMSFIGIDQFESIRVEGISIPGIQDTALDKAFKQVNDLVL